MATWHDLTPSRLSRDLAAGLVVSLVALPLCLGVALASNAPLISGLVAGIVGGILVGALSGSQASVSGPAAGLTAVVASQIAALGSFEAFLLAVMIAGVMQIALGLARAGSLAAFFPSSVIKGLMAAIGVILILKQIPHALGHDPDPEGDMAFLQPDDANTFSEFGRLLGDIQPGAALVGLVSIAVLVAWERWRFLKRSHIPAPLVVALLGVAISLALRRLGGRWVIEPSHLVQMPVADSFAVSNVRRPLRRVVEKHLGGEVIHIELANQVSFLNRAALDRVLNQIPRGGHVLLDAHNTDYIDPDLLSLIRDFKEHTAPARGVEVSLLGFRRRYNLWDETRYVDHSTRELQSTLTPQQVLDLLKDGHERCRTGHRLTRDYSRQLSTTAPGQHPLAVVLNCIDSRTPAELIFDLGMGDIFSVRIAGNVASRKVLGSVEYGCRVAGARLILVMGHTRCGAVTAAVDLAGSSATVAGATGCQHLEHIVHDIQELTDPLACREVQQLPAREKELFVNAVARRHVARVVDQLLERSQTLGDLVRDGRLAIVGAMYDVATGDIEFLPQPADGPCERRTSAMRAHEDLA
jgi:carbonic anhydrase